MPLSRMPVSAVCTGNAPGAKTTWSATSVGLLGALGAIQVKLHVGEGGKLPAKNTGDGAPAGPILTVLTQIADVTLLHRIEARLKSGSKVNSHRPVSNGGWGSLKDWAERWPEVNEKGRLSSCEALEERG